MIPAWRQGDRWPFTAGPIPPNVGLSWSVLSQTNGVAFAGSDYVCAGVNYNGTPICSTINQFVEVLSDFSLRFTNASYVSGGGRMSILAHVPPTQSQAPGLYYNGPSGGFPVDRTPICYTTIPGGGALLPRRTDMLASNYAAERAFGVVGGKLVFVNFSVQAAERPGVWWLHRLPDATWLWEQKTAFSPFPHVTTIGGRIFEHLGELFFITNSTPAGFYKSSDHGITWTSVPGGPPPNGYACTSGYLSWRGYVWYFDPVTGNVYASKDCQFWTLMASNIDNYNALPMDIYRIKAGVLLPGANTLYLLYSFMNNWDPPFLRYTKLLRSPS